MEDQPIRTTPPNRRDLLIQEKYIEEIAAQAERLDALGRQLITLELAVPGLYATLFKLVSGEKATMMLNSSIYIAFVCWLLALVLSLWSLVPRTYTVDPRHLEGRNHCASNSISVMDFFYCSARFKRRLLIPSGLLLFAGVFVVAVDLL
ncbi:MAG: hypothetical protein KDI27_05570 [Gammaproteobacteria bacterium]|nr:hypothetical protein [Gammaproteobacteria bacterium]